MSSIPPAVDMPPHGTGNYNTSSSSEPFPADASPRSSSSEAAKSVLAAGVEAVLKQPEGPTTAAGMASPLADTPTSQQPPTPAAFAVSKPQQATAATASSQHLPLLPLLDINVIDLIDADPRPTFVLSLTPQTVSPDNSSPSIVYYNPALSSSPTLREILASPRQDNAIFNDGIADAAEKHASAASVVHLGRRWTRMILRGSQFAVISANEPVSVEASAPAASAVDLPAPSSLTAFAPSVAEKAAGRAERPLPNQPTIPSALVPIPPIRPTSPLAPTTGTTTTSISAPVFSGPPSVSSANKTDADDNNRYTRQFSDMTEFLPVGLCILNPDGDLVTANHAWYFITGCPRPRQGSVFTLDMFRALVAENDRYKFDNFCTEVDRLTIMTFGFRVKQPGDENDPEASAETAPAADSAPVAASTSLPGLPTLAGGPVSRTSTPTPTQEKRASPPPILRSSRHPAEVAKAKPRGSHVLATVHADKDSDGNLVRILVCLIDTTEHRNIAEAADRHAQQASNLRRMAEFATVGMYDMDIDGRLRGANRVFYEMCGLQKEQSTNLAEEVIRPWTTCVAEEDQPLLKTCLKRLMAEGEHQTAELRFKEPWTSDDGAGNQIVAPCWMEATFLPVKDGDGEVRAITGCVTNVSLRKWQLDRERQVKDEAIESKRQQEYFVDMTSHEIRNPLTVIMNCGDAVIDCLHHLRAISEHHIQNGGFAGNPADADFNHQKTLLEDSIENAEIIVSSALHQKSIVDDILTMSKLDSDRLAVTPVIVDPVDIVRSTLKMFDLQARQEHIALGMKVGLSFHDLGLRLLTFDPSRVKQILINLLTNALKFTRSGTKREITIKIGASSTRPTDQTCAVSFVPRQEGRSAATTKALATGYLASSQGDSVFLIFEVKDTGEGLTKEGMDTLFQKFVQVDSSTHVKHGGSGLGLFISKRLAEIQNGAIGVASTPGSGSTFAFYIEAHIPPPTAVPMSLLSPELARQAFVMSSSTSALPQGEPSGAGQSQDCQCESPTLANDDRRNSVVAAVLSATSTSYGFTDGSADSRVTTATDSNTSGGLSSPTSPSVTSPPEIQGILLVDDNEINLKVTRRYFERSGFQVYLATNGLEALDKIRQSDRFVPGSFPISVVLMDMEMPVQDGLSCTREIRALEASGAISGSRIPILMITGNARPYQIADAFAADCDDVVVKPFQMQQLYDHIQTVVRTLWERDNNNNNHNDHSPIEGQQPSVSQE